MNVEPGLPFFVCALEHTMTIMNIGIEAALEVAARKFKYLGAHLGDCYEALLELDLGNGQFCKTDVEELEASKKKTKRKEQDRQDYARAWLLRKRSITSAARKSDLRVRLGGRVWRPIARGMTQPQAKECVPIGARVHIWEARSSQAWR